MAGELGDGDHAPRRLRHPRQRKPAVRPCPAVEGLRVPQHREVVEGYDQRHSGAKRRPLCGAVENVHSVAPCPFRQRRQVPAEIPHRHKASARAAEGIGLELDTGLVLECCEQRADVACRAGPRQRERRDIDAHAQRLHLGESVCQSALVARQHCFAAGPPGEARGVGEPALSQRGRPIERALQRRGEGLGILWIGTQSRVARCFV